MNISLEIENAYRRGVSQGVAFAAYSAKKGTPAAANLEAYRKDVYDWRCGLHRERPQKTWTDWAGNSPAPEPKGEI